MVRLRCERLLTGWVAVACVVTSATQLGQRPLKRAQELGGYRWGSRPENERLKMRQEAGWDWDFPNEPPAYRARQEQREEEIMTLTHTSERLDNWVQFTQIRVVSNFTRLGFDVVDAPPELFARLQKRFYDALEAGPRQEGSVPIGIYGPTKPDFVHHGESNLLDALRPIHEEWAPSAGPLRGTASYGIRIYRRGNALAWHADRVDTHVISSILHVGHHYDDDKEPWPIEIEGHDGKLYQVALEPGQMLLYESAKCPHGRSSALKGNFYGALFCHFMPQDREQWPYSQEDVWLAVPPGWGEPPIGHSGEGRWAGAFLTHDMMEVAGMPPRSEQELRLARLRRRPTRPADPTVRPSPPLATGSGTSSSSPNQEKPKEASPERDETQHNPPNGFNAHDLLEPKATESAPFVQGWNVAIEAGLGPSLLVSAFGLLFFFASGGTLIGLAFLFRRILVTRGRSLTRPKHLKTDEDRRFGLSLNCPSGNLEARA